MCASARPFTWPPRSAKLRRQPELTTLTTMTSDNTTSDAGLAREPAAHVFVAFLKLGLTSFGGPIAHLGFFRDEFVARRKWLDEASYADVVALCQFLPGPASSQVGITIGMLRAGLPGALL